MSEEVPLLTLRDPLPAVIETEPELVAYAELLAAGTGPVALDAERASGHRYSQRAYLIQVRREGAGTALIDPIAFDSLAPLIEAIDGCEWILHAATQDLACLAEVGLRPTALFDTELAGRLLGYPRVGLATLVETLLGKRLRKEHSAVDWSTRPFPQSWLEYAALDVEVLVELRDSLAAELDEAGKREWADQEFDALLSFEPPVRIDPWRRTSGSNKVKSRRGFAALKLLWETRDAIAAERDITPSKIVPDSALVAGANSQADTRQSLLATKGFHGRGAKRYVREWLDAIKEAQELEESELPERRRPATGPPQPRNWANRSAEAAARLGQARQAVSELAEELELPVENLLTPDTLRRVLWTPPEEREPAALREGVRRQLRELGARPWQIELTSEPIAQSIEDAASAAAQSDESDEPDSDGD